MDANSIVAYWKHRLIAMAENPPYVFRDTTHDLIEQHHLATGEFDCPPMQWTETEREPRQVAETFAEMLNAELRLMETNNQAYREQGGSYLTLYPGGGATESHPALANGKRPLDAGTAPNRKL